MLLQISKICIISREKEQIMKTETDFLKKRTNFIEKESLSVVQPTNIFETELVELDYGSHTELIHTPSDFLSYILVFWQYRSLHIAKIVAKLDYYEYLQKMAQDTKNPEKAAEAKEKLEAIPLSEAVSWAYEFESQMAKYGPKKNEKSMSQKVQIKDFNKEQVIDNLSERPVLNELFEGQLWSVFDYLQKANGFEHITDTLEQLVVDTVHHLCPDRKSLPGLDLSSYQQAHKPSKSMSKQDREYGNYFIIAAGTYAALRAQWLRILNVDSNLALKFESAVALSARLGHNHHNFRYAINCGSGGSTKGDKHFAEARTLLHEYYLKLCKKEISRNALVNEMYSHEDMLNSPEYEALAEAHKNLMNEKTISKLIKQWDKENGIDRTKFKKSTKPRIKTMVG